MLLFKAEAHTCVTFQEGNVLISTGRIDLDPSISIRYTNTKQQFIDVLTKGSFTLDKWNDLLLLFGIMSGNNRGRAEVPHRSVTNK